MNRFKESLKELLEEKNLSRLQLAQKIGITSTTINGYFNKGYYPQIDICLKLANFFNCSLDYLFGFSASKESKYILNKDNLLTNFITNFNILLKDNHLSIAKAMKAVNMSEYNYFRWKNGKFPKTINIITIAKYFDASIDELLGKTHQPKQ